MTTVNIAAPPQLKKPAISRYASTTIKFKSLGANIMGVPKSEKLTANMTNAVDKTPGITNGKVTAINVNQLFAPIFLEASSREVSVTLNAATKGHNAYGKKKNICTIAIPVIE